jgi:predicted nucleotidyltransferase component of viral defense system
MVIVYNKNELGKTANKYGFVRDTFEKVLRLKEILFYCNTNSFLSEHLVLKGGTAINMLIFDLPRLSVDIDMDFIPNVTKEEMMDARTKISSIIKDYLSIEGYRLSPASRFSFSLDSFLCQYTNSAGNLDTVKIEINYSLRAHIFKPIMANHSVKAFKDAFPMKTLYPLELFAAKTNALLSRAAARDLYDFTNMISFGLIGDNEKPLFRKCVIFYNTISQETTITTFDTSEIDTLTFHIIKRDLLPMIRGTQFFDFEKRKIEAKSFIESLMHLTPNEIAYIESFQQHIYRPELLFDDEEIVQNIQQHPMALWKCRK